MFDKILVILLMICAWVFLRLTMEESQKHQLQLTSSSSGTIQITTYQQNQNTKSQTTNNETNLIKWAQSKKITNAKTLTEFRPNDDLTRAEFAKMIVTYMASENKLDTNERSSQCLFYDFQKAGDLALYIYDACNNSLMKGTNGYFYPQNSVSIAEVIVTITRIIRGNMDETLQPRYANYTEFAKLNKRVEYDDINQLQIKASRIKALQLLYKMTQKK